MCCLVKMEDLDLPEIKRRKIQERKAEDKEEFKGLFQSDSDSDDSDTGLKIKSKESPALKTRFSPNLTTSDRGSPDLSL